MKVDLKHRLLKAFCHITYLIYPSLKGTVKAREDLFKSIPYEGSKYVTNHSGAYGNGETVLKEVMGEGTLADFEHLKAKIPSDPHAYLSHVYGDYMTPPPPEKRVGHH